MKRPAFQFYPADWRKDAALQSCSIAARGLWIELLCIAHECEPYGHLTVNGNPLRCAQIARLVGVTAKECDQLFRELYDAGVIKMTEDGTYYSLRMVRDEQIRTVRADAGRLGGNPNLLKQKDNQTVNQRDNHLDNQGDKQIPTPSSSSSSSTSVKDKKPKKPKRTKSPETPMPEDWGLLELQQAYAAKHLPDVDTEALAETIRGTALAKGWRYVDWSQHWQTLVRQWAPNSGHWSEGQYPKKKPKTDEFAGMKWM